MVDDPVGTVSWTGKLGVVVGESGEMPVRVGSGGGRGRERKTGGQGIYMEDAASCCVRPHGWDALDGKGLAPVGSPFYASLLIATL